MQLSLLDCIDHISQYSYLLSCGNTDKYPVLGLRKMQQCRVVNIVATHALSVMIYQDMWHELPDEMPKNEDEKLKIFKQVHKNFASVLIDE